MIDLRTPVEKAREARHQQICADYVKLKGLQPDAKPHRLFTTLASKYSMTTPGVKNILIAKGLYSTKK